MPRTARHQKNLRRATEVAAPRVLPPMPFTPFTTAWMENLSDPNAWPECCDCCDDGFDRREYEHWRAFFLEECGKDIDVDYDAVEDDYKCDDRYDEYGYDCYDDDYDHYWSYDSDHYHTVHYGAITDRRDEYSELVQSFVKSGTDRGDAGCAPGSFSSSACGAGHQAW